MAISRALAIMAALFLGTGTATAMDLTFVRGSAQVFAQPHDLVLSPDGRFLYVADNNNHRIAVLDPASLELLGTFGDGEVGAPHDVAFDGAGRLLVADTNNSRIAIYAVDGVRGQLAGELTGAIRRPEGVAVHPNGRIYATGAASGNIEVFENGRAIASAGGLSSPHDVAVANDGTLWVADANNDRLVRYTASLELVEVIEGAPYDFNGPRYLDFDDKGRLFVADKYTHQIKILGRDGTLLKAIGSGRGELGPGVFDRPEGVEILGSTVWFSDTYNDRIVTYTITN